jgi:hypothetical protein
LTLAESQRKQLLAQAASGEANEQLAAKASRQSRSNSLIFALATTGESTFDLDISTLPEGVYYLRATAGNALPLMRKVLIER